MGFITVLPTVLSVPAFGATVMYLIVRAVQSMKHGAQLDFAELCGLVRDGGSR